VTAAPCPRCGAAVPAREIEIGEVGIVLAPEHDERVGLLAWARLKVGPFLLAGLSVRRNLAGDLTVTFPARKDRRGTLHREVTPLDPDLDRRIRAVVIAAYVAERAKHRRRDEP
jgi:hypothetical protein